MNKRKFCKKIIETEGCCDRFDSECRKCRKCPIFHECFECVNMSLRIKIAKKWLKDHPKKSKTPGLDAWKPKPGEEIKFGTDRKNKDSFIIKELDAEDHKRNEVFLSLPNGEQIYLIGNKHIYINILEVKV